MSVKNQVQLITYPDSLGGDLRALNEILSRYFSDIFRGGVHILPPFPSSGDRGFAPLTYLEIEPTFGAWEDIRRIGEGFDVMLDLMVNHISRQSPYFQDFVRKGRESEYADMFITLDKVWLDGDPPQEDVAKIFLRRPEHPFSDITIEETGQVERIWTSFGKETPSEQIDIDVRSEQARELLAGFLAHFAQQGVKIVRLDAVAYVTKRAGTNCFFVEPEIFQFMGWITEVATSLGIVLLPEVHAHYSIQRKLAEHSYWVYDFVLPALILHTLLSKSSQKLHDYLETCPRKQFTMLDCHDGIPIMPDMDGILEANESSKIVDTCVWRGANLSHILSPQHKAKDGFDVHQIGCTYYSALGCDDDAYLAARAIQFFAPGVPLVYYVGLLAGENDHESVKLTGEGRAINRHNYSAAEIDQALQKEVVQRLLKLIRFRNEYPAFGGSFGVLKSGDKDILLSWQRGNRMCSLIVGLCTNQAVITYVDDTGELQEYKV
ncbi:MAG: sucrose phosphorylase [Anaerolineae bacterium]|nr:sucrose phosphorylase [Anaerolineae bacterium]